MVDILGALYRIFVVGMVIALLCVFIYMDQSSRKKSKADTKTPSVAASSKPSEIENSPTAANPGVEGGFEVDYTQLSIDLPDSYEKWELGSSDDLRNIPGSDIFRTDEWSGYSEQHPPLLAATSANRNNNPSDLRDGDYR